MGNVAIILPLKATHALARAGAELETEEGPTKLEIENDLLRVGKLIFPEDPEAIINALKTFYTNASQPLALCSN